MAVFGALLACALVMLATAAANNDFFNSDAPRHALNGAFLLDFVTAMPWRDPVGWAMDYYIRYPALTIGYYPPLFHAVEAVFFAVFGVSHHTAQAVVGVYLFFLGLGAYRLARLYLPRWSALGVALMLLGLPHIMFWGRQVMLDIPVQATILWAVFCFARYLQSRRTGFLAGATVLVVAAIYTKLTAIFIIPPLLLALLLARGASVLRDRAVLLALLGGGLALVPAVLMTLRFGSVNLDNFGPGHPTDALIGSPAYWLYYLRVMPIQMGPLMLAAAVLSAGFLLWKRPYLGPRWQVALFAGWFVLGLGFFTFIREHESRHDMMILFPLVLGIGLALRSLPSWRAAQAATFALGLFSFSATIIANPAPEVSGYREVADYVAKNMPAGGVVLFSGYRDGNFIFSMRSHPERRDLAILRADKLLLSITVMREWGVRESDLEEAGIAAMLKEYGVSMVVAQRGFWDDLRQMHRLSAVLHSDQFRKVATFEAGGDISSQDSPVAPGRSEVEVFRPTYQVSRPTPHIEIDVPFIGVRLRGRLDAGGS